MAKIKTQGWLKGKPWSTKNPEKVNDLVVVAWRDGKRTTSVIGPPTPANQRRAEKVVADIARLGERQVQIDSGSPMTFEEAGEAYIGGGFAHRRAKTAVGRTYQVRVLSKRLGDRPLSEISSDDVLSTLDWLMAPESHGGRGISRRTAGCCMDAASRVFKHAKYRPHEGAPIHNPTVEARAEWNEQIKGTAAAKELDASNCNPVSAEDMAKILAELDCARPGERFDKRSLRITVYLAYEAGPRLHETTGLRWEDVWLGESPHMQVGSTRRDGKEAGTKSGGARRVEMSQRLRDVLQRWKLESGNPAGDAFIVSRNWGSNIRSRLDSVCKQAKVARVTPKQFRDTFASVQLTEGIALPWISSQLGHANTLVAQRHYAKFISTSYRNPWAVPEGCTPADVLAERDGYKPSPTVTAPEDRSPAMKCCGSETEAKANTYPGLRRGKPATQASVSLRSDTSY